MKKYLFLTFVFIGLLLAVGCIIYVPYSKEYPPPQEKEYYEREYRDYSVRYDTSYFYDYLSPHGMWVYQPPYGYVWIPRVYRYGWRPYTYGSWIWTDYGWTWISDWDWGWIPFHYGRWGWDEYLGWFWVPDTVWGPAWVTWRRSDLYIGWAPLPPDVRFVPGIGIRSITYGIPEPYWVFVEYPHFYHTQVYRYMLPFERNRTIISTTIHKTNIVERDRRVINEGIERDFIQNKINKQIITHRLRDAGREVKTVIGIDQVEVFRPNIQQNETAKPKTVVRKEDVQGEIARLPVTQTDEVGQVRSESTLQELQKREWTVMKESQEKEIGEIRKTSEVKKEEAQTAAEKVKIEKETQAKIGELKKKHEAEESKLKERQKEEETEAKVKKIKIKKE